MWKELKQIWFSDNLLSESWDMSYEALKIDAEMFDDAVSTLWGGDQSATQKLIFKKDKLINKYERDIRRKVLTHLSVQQGEGISAGLILSTVIVDIERIGDYIKNIVDLAEMHPGELGDKEIRSTLSHIESAIRKSFKQAQTCLEEDDEDIAFELYQDTRELGKTCDENIRALIQSEAQRDSSYIVYALYFRYLKRINAHLRNMISSVINPYDRIGYKPKSDLNT